MTAPPADVERDRRVAFAKRMREHRARVAREDPADRASIEAADVRRKLAELAEEARRTETPGVSEGDRDRANRDADAWLSEWRRGTAAAHAREYARWKPRGLEDDLAEAMQEADPVTALVRLTGLGREAAATVVAVERSYRARRSRPAVLPGPVLRSARVA